MLALHHQGFQESEYVANHNEGFTITDEAIKIITEEWMEAMNNEDSSRC